MKTTTKQKTAGLSKRTTIFIDLYFVTCFIVGALAFITNLP